MKRSVIEALERRKEAMIGALWSNSNYDSQEEGKEAPRNEAIREIEENFDIAVQKILTGKTAPTEEEIDLNNPFFAAAIRGQKKIQAPRNDEGKVADVVKDEYEKLDQF